MNHLRGAALNGVVREGPGEALHLPVEGCIKVEFKTFKKRKENEK